MIRRADLEQVVHDAAVMNLDDLRSRGETIIAEAQAHAERVIAQAQAERDRLLSDAQEVGHAKGYAEGLEAGQAIGQSEGGESARAAEAESISSSLAALDTMREEFETKREQMLRDARVDLVRLAVEIAKRVTRRAVDLDPQAVASQLEVVLETVVRPTRLIIRVNTDDLDAAQRAMPGLLEKYEQCRHADVISDPSLSRGSAVATTEAGGRIDASIDAQLKRIVAELLPDVAIEEHAARVEKDADSELDQRSDAA
ncbi:MAG: FliH/SctL family protein [Phycisphaerales bacterium]